MGQERKVVVTGGSGFIGSNFIKYWIEKYPNDSIVNFDKLTYAGNPANLKEIESNSNYQFIQGDIVDEVIVNRVLKGADIVVNFAAESHNSYAVINPGIFFDTNTKGTQVLLEASRNQKVERFHQISTCEVYGDLPLNSKRSFKESSPLRPRTPYNASKAGADMAVRAYHETYGLKVTTTNCCNNFGPYQFPEKVIPLFTTNVIDGKQMPLYEHSQNKREWLHVLDHCRAIDLVIHQGIIGKTYNVGTGVELSVEEIVDIVLDELRAPSSLKIYVPDRPGHDRRYLLDSTKIRQELGWAPRIDVKQGIRETVKWYRDNRDWWESLKGRAPVVEEEWENS